MGWAEIAVSSRYPRVPDISSNPYTKQLSQGWPVNSPKRDARTLSKVLSSVFPSFAFLPPASLFFFLSATTLIPTLALFSSMCNDIWRDRSVQCCTCLRCVRLRCIFLFSVEFNFLPNHRFWSCSYCISSFP